MMQALRFATRLRLHARVGGVFLRIPSRYQARDFGKFLKQDRGEGKVSYSQNPALDFLRYIVNLVIVVNTQSRGTDDNMSATPER